MGYSEAWTQSTFEVKSNNELIGLMKDFGER